MLSTLKVVQYLIGQLMSSKKKKKITLSFVWKIQPAPKKLH